MTKDSFPTNLIHWPAAHICVSVACDCLCAIALLQKPNRKDRYLASIIVASILGIGLVLPSYSTTPKGRPPLALQRKPVSVIGYCQVGCPGPLSTQIEGAILIDIEGKILLPGISWIIAEKLHKGCIQILVLACEIVWVAEEHFKVACDEFTIVLEDIGMSDG